MSAIAVTEPDAGSDVAAIKTRAVRDGDDWVINGSKIYITNAATADWLCLLAVTDPDAGYGGFSQIIVPTDSPGFRYDLLDKIGNWGSDTGLLFFENVRVPVAYTIGEIGRGFQQQMMQFQDERLVGCISSIAAAQDNWESTRAWAEQRIVFGKPLVEDAGDAVQVRRDAHAAHRGARAHLRVHPRAQPRRGRDAADHDGEDLLRARRALRRRRVHPALGGYGYMKESAAGRAFVDSRLISIGGGSDETMIHYLAKQLGFYRASFAQRAEGERSP